ncbi:B3 domain-containing protein Os01g0723500-like isoform X2 [Tasmannia lanceolata]
MKHISEEASSKGTAILEGPSSKVWHVELSKQTNGTYLQDGWQEFAKAHSLRVSEFLVFRYDGNMRFSVKFFDKTACEREDIFTSFHGPKTQGWPPKKSLDFGPIVSQQKACEIDSKNYLSDNLCTAKLSFRGEHKPSPKPEQVVRIETEDHDLPVSVGGRVHYLRRRQHMMSEEKIKAQDRVHYLRRRQHMMSEEKGKAQDRVHYLGRRQHMMSEEKGKAQDRANSFTSDFPFFMTIITVLQLRRGFFVWIPAQFAKAHLPKERVKIILRDPKGRTWEAKLNISRHRYTISAGWIAFARGNNLEEGDSCIFELVGKLKMRVHIFRLARENKARIKSQAI